MTLASTEWGAGNSVVLLLHGMLGSSHSWARVAEQIAARGHRVIGLDLPGHGESAPQPHNSVQRVVDLVVETWSTLSPMQPVLAMGHSYGGTILAAALDRLRPHSVVYVDSPFTKRGGWDPKLVRAHYADGKASRTVEGLRARRPFYSDHDVEIEALAADLRRRGIDVRDIPGGEHSLWYGHFDEFMTAIADRY